MSSNPQGRQPQALILKFMKIPVGRKCASHDIALTHAFEFQLDILLVEETW